MKSRENNTAVEGIQPIGGGDESSIFGLETLQHDAGVFPC